MKPITLLTLFGMPLTDTALTGLALSFVLMALAFWIGRSLQERPGRWQASVEALIAWLSGEIEDVVGEENVEEVLPLIATLALWILMANVIGMIPVIPSPTADFSVTSAAAFLVFAAVPYFGIRKHGLKQYLKIYLEPTPYMLPFTIIGELSRTIALAVRLFGNVLSGNLIVAVVISLAGVLVPVPLMALSLLTSVLQAYIFAILSIVYIGAAVAAREESETTNLVEGVS